MPERILICGSREWNDFTTIKEFLKPLEKDTVIIHGGCRGTNAIAGYLAKQLGLEVVVFKALWKTEGKSTDPKMN